MNRDEIRRKIAITEENIAVTKDNIAVTKEKIKPILEDLTHYPPSYQCNVQQGIQRRRYEDALSKHEDTLKEYEDDRRKYEDALREHHRLRSNSTQVFM